MKILCILVDSESIGQPRQAHIPMTSESLVFSAQEMTDRLARIRSAMAAGGLDALVSSDAANAYYTTGFRGEPRTLLITADSLTLFTSFRTLPWAEAQTELLADHIELSTAPRPFDDIVKRLSGKTLNIGVDRSVSYASMLSWQELFSPHALRPCSIIEQVRRTKSPTEVAIMRQSQVINEAIFNAVLPQIRPGMTERGVQGLILAEMAANEDVDAYSFMPIVAVGLNAWEIHHLPDHTVIQENDMILIDHGVFYQGYASDMTRTICLGTASEQMHDIYNTVGAAQDAAIQAIRAGVSTREIDQTARDVISAAGHGRSFTHGLGHSIGLETHDPGLNFNQADEPTLLEPGMAFTVEPGIYLENGFGVRTEDVVIVTENGHTNLTTQTHALIERPV